MAVAAARAPAAAVARRVAERRPVVSSRNEARSAVRGSAQLSTLLAPRTQPTLQASAPAPETGGDKRMYRMRDGRTIELPPDMTAEEAAQLEAEARAAEKHLG